MPSSTYLMNDRREKKRLRLKVEPKEFIRRYLAPYGLKNKKVLDVGCGPGVITAQIAVSNPTSEIFGLDAYPDRFSGSQSLGLRNLQFVEGWAEKLPFKSNSFDLVFTRFLLEYAKKPDLIISEIKRVLKPGGRVVLQDLDGQLIWHYPEPDKMIRDIGVVLKHLGKTGFDPFVGRKLFHLSKKVKFKRIEIKIEPYHLIAGKIDKKNLVLWKLKLDVVLPHVQRALGSLKRAERLKRDFIAYLKSRDTLTYSNVITIVGMK